jgi:hypothetical protein
MDRQLNARAGAPQRRRIGRRVAWTGVLIVVLVAHLLATRELAERMADFDAGQTMPKRIEVAYVRTIEPEAPPVGRRAGRTAAEARARGPARAACAAPARRIGAEAAPAVVAEASAPAPAPAPVAAASEAEPASTAVASASAPASEATARSPPRRPRAASPARRPSNGRRRRASAMSSPATTAAT